MRPSSSSSLSSSNLTDKKYISSNQIINTNESDSSSEFLDRINGILCRKQLIEDLIPSSLSQIRDLSDSEFTKKLLELLKLISKEYIEKQKNVRIELEKKQRYISDYQQTQLMAYQELNNKFKLVLEEFQTLNRKYQEVNHFYILFKS